MGEFSDMLMLHICTCIFIRREVDFVNTKVHCVLCDKLYLPRLGNVMMPEIDFLQPPVTYSEMVILHSSLVRC